MGGIITIHARTKSNSVENIKNNLLVKQEQKQDLLSKYKPLLEVGKVEDIDDYRTKVFPDIKFTLPIIICSDNHDIKNYSTKAPLWIKADPTFEGLKQILYEPDERVRVQKTKPEEKDIYQVIGKIMLKESGFWDDEINFNPNLNTIIGGRSTGKSSLLKAIALKHNLTIEKEDFINNHIDGITISWLDGIEQLQREIEYFGQGYMYDIALDTNKRDKLIDGIIRQKDNDTLNNFDISNTAISKEITENIFSIFQLQKDIKQLEDSLKEKGNKQGINQQLEILSQKAETLRNNNNLTSMEQCAYEAYKREISEYKSKISIIDNDILNLSKLKDDLLINFSIEEKYPYLQISDINRKQVDDIFNNIKTKLNSFWTERICNIIKEIELSKETITKEIKAIEDKDEYKKGERAFANNRELQDINTKTDEEKQKIYSIENIEKELVTKKKRLEALITAVVKAHCSYKKKSEDIKKKIYRNYEDLVISVDIYFHKDEMETFLRDRLNQRGNERQDYIQKILDNYDKDNEIVVDEFLKNLISEKIVLKSYNDPTNVAMEYFKRNWYSLRFNIRYQNDDFSSMSEGKQAFVILKLLLDFSDKKCPILIDQPEDSLDNRAIYNELVSYIKKKKKERQIILVTHNPNIVVGADAENVIVANQNGINSKNTNGNKFHYINGAIENTTQKDNKNDDILSSQGIREHICDILEGGKSAFEKRENKYGFKNNLKH